MTPDQQAAKDWLESQNIFICPFGNIRMTWDACVRRAGMPIVRVGGTKKFFLTKYSNMHGYRHCADRECPHYEEARREARKRNKAATRTCTYSSGDWRQKL